MELYNLIKGEGGRALNTQGNGHPDYSVTLSAPQIWNLVKFMREDWIYPDYFYFVAVDGPPVYTNSAGTVVMPVVYYYGVGVNGSASAGIIAYNAKCAGCHGANGTTLNMGGASVGELVRTKPHEVWHKAKYGEIGDSSVAFMAPGLVVDTTEMADIYRALTNTVTYPDI